MLKKLLKISFQNKKLFLLYFFLVIAVSVRFLWLDKFPVGINHDEVDVILSAKSYWKFGTDASGFKFPTALISTKTEAGLSGLPSFLLSPYIGVFPLSLFFVRLPYVFINLASLFFLALIAERISGKKALAYVAFGVGLLNPWLFLYSRATTEAPFALLFILIGIYLLLREKGRRILLSSIAFILAFYSYFGAKPVFPIFVPLLLVVHKFFIAKTQLKTYLIYILLAVLSMGVYFAVQLKIPDSTLSSRSDEVIFFDLAKYSTEVNEQRRASINFTFRTLYFNKIRSLVENSLSKYMGYISSDFLFFKGDEAATYRMEEHGVIYKIDLLFIVLGLVYLGKHFKKGRGWLLFTFLGILFFVAPIPAAISSVGRSYFFRGFLLIPGIIILISLGILFLIENLRGKYLRWALAITLILYLGYFVNFLIFFFYRYPVKQGENHFISERVLSSYLEKATDREKKVAVVTKEPLAKYQQYIFYSNNVQLLGGRRPDGIIFTEDCVNLKDYQTVVYDSHVKCDIQDREFLVIQNQKDTGAIFRIFNDTLCKDALLTPYRRSHLISDYDIEKMDDATFCNRWINKYEE